MVMLFSAEALSFHSVVSILGILAQLLSGTSNGVRIFGLLRHTTMTQQWREPIINGCLMVSCVVFSFSLILLPYLLAFPHIQQLVDVSNSPAPLDKKPIHHTPLTVIPTLLSSHHTQHTPPSTEMADPSAMEVDTPVEQVEEGEYCVLFPPTTLTQSSRSPKSRLRSD